MDKAANSFWDWFCSWERRLPSNDFPDELQDELLAEIHAYDPRLYFLISTTSTPRELIITVEGNPSAMATAETFVAAAPKLPGWKFIALKPGMGFQFQHRDGPITLDVSELWFMPLRSRREPSMLGISICFPDADYVLEHQSVDTAYTILETAVGERICMKEIAHVEVQDTPDDPEELGYLRLPDLPAYLEFHKRKQGSS